MAADRPHRSRPHAPAAAGHALAPRSAGQDSALGGLSPQGAPLSANTLRALQRTSGNQAVQRMLRQRGNSARDQRRVAPQPLARLLLQREMTAWTKVNQDDAISLRFTDSYFANLRQSENQKDQADTDANAVDWFIYGLRTDQITEHVAKQRFKDLSRYSYNNFNFLARWDDSQKRLVVSHIDYQGGFNHALFREDLKKDRAIDRNVIFGLDGRDEAQLCKALDLGYRVFDMALSYKNTETFAKVLGDRKDIARKDVWLIYKFDIPPQSQNLAEDVEGHLVETAKLFGAYLNEVLIHNLHLPKSQIEQTLSVMKKLQEQGVVKRIGVSNLYPGDAVSFQLDKEAIEAPFDAIQTVENNASPLTENANSKALARNKKISYYGYNVMPQSLRQHPDIAELARYLKITPAQLLIAHAERRGVLPIVSASSADNMADNLYAPKLSSEQLEQIDKLMIAIKTKEKDQISQAKIPSTTDSVRQLMMLLSPLSSGVFEKPAVQQYFVNLDLFKNDSNFQEFMASTIPPHDTINADYHHINIGTLLEGFPNNSCGTSKKAEALCLAASLHEVNSKKPIVSQTILQRPQQQQSEVIEIDD
ncbi:MAG TPA: aldo/keto reductase [Roseiflexaceae bacterium]|nr:aldo/keto reductase [Roseiflexaceae bacterium]